MLIKVDLKQVILSKITAKQKILKSLRKECQNSKKQQSDLNCKTDKQTKKSSTFLSGWHIRQDQVSDFSLCNMP